MIRNLLRPLAYLAIGHRQKWRVDWLYPAILAIATTGLLFLLKLAGNVQFYGEGGMIARVLSFVQGLPGFYIAALAAIATFNRPDIDKTMPSPAPRIDIQVQGHNVEIELTRRRFLCLMFAFLTAESLIIIILAILAQSAAVPLKALMNDSLRQYTSALFVFVFSLVFWQMVIATFWGLFYLGDRLHQPDSNAGQ
jgi:hypothetical protein